MAAGGAEVFLPFHRVTDGRRRLRAAPSRRAGVPAVRLAVGLRWM